MKLISAANRRKMHKKNQNTISFAFFMPFCGKAIFS